MPVEPYVLRDGIARLSKLGATNPPIEDLLNEVVGAIQSLFGLSGAGFMMVDDRNALRSVASSDRAGEVLETAQRDHGEGPCIDALVFDTTTTCADLARDPRYRKVGPALAEQGIHAVIGVPIRVGGGSVGSLNVYVDQPHEWTGDEIAALETYGQLLAGFLAAALSAHQKSEVADQLQYALDYRVVIERAVGYLMARHDTTAVEAFDTLRRAARDRQRRVADVAGDVLERRIPL